MCDLIDALQRLCAALKLNDTLWLDTPNVASSGAKRIGRDWHDLDPPRHSISFNLDSLKLALMKTGFRNVQQHWRGPPVFDVLAPSEAMARGVDATAASHRVRPHTRRDDRVVGGDHSTRHEFLTLSAHK